MLFCRCSTRLAPRAPAAALAVSAARWDVFAAAAVAPAPGQLGAPPVSSAPPPLARSHAPVCLLHAAALTPHPLPSLPALQHKSYR